MPKPKPQCPKADDIFSIGSIISQTPGRSQKVDPPILDSKNSYGLDYRTLRWIYLLDPPKGLGLGILEGQDDPKPSNGNQEKGYRPVESRRPCSPSDHDLESIGPKRPRISHSGSKA